MFISIRRELEKKKQELNTADHFQNCRKNIADIIMNDNNRNVS